MCDTRDEDPYPGIIKKVKKGIKAEKCHTVSNEMMSVIRTINIFGGRTSVYECSWDISLDVEYKLLDEIFSMLRDSQKNILVLDICEHLLKKCNAYNDIKVKLHGLRDDTLVRIRGEILIFELICKRRNIINIMDVRKYIYKLAYGSYYNDVIKMK
jgi:hypothetical protein